MNSKTAYNSTNVVLNVFGTYFVSNTMYMVNDHRWRLYGSYISIHHSSQHLTPSVQEPPYVYPRGHVYW